ncbi:MAG: hypothetical protein J5I53_07605 [Bradyrhizobiaceae bacterium]|nr:hypothetical protein [Bradyrhizobiaceae bacterium]
MHTVSGGQSRPRSQDKNQRTGQGNGNVHTGLINVQVKVSATFTTD